MSQQKLLTFLAEEEHFATQDGFKKLFSRIQHFNLEEFGVIIIKVPESVTMEQRKKLVPLLNELQLREINRQKSSFVATDIYTLDRDPDPEDPHYEKRTYNWKQWMRKNVNTYLATPEHFWEYLEAKKNANEPIEYGVAEPGTLIADGKYKVLFRFRSTTLFWSPTIVRSPSTVSFWLP